MQTPHRCLPISTHGYQLDARIGRVDRRQTGIESGSSERCEASPRRTACHPTRSDSMMAADIEQPED